MVQVDSEVIKNELVFEMRGRRWVRTDATTMFVGDFLQQGHKRIIETMIGPGAIPIDGGYVSPQGETNVLHVFGESDTFNIKEDNSERAASVALWRALAAPVGVTIKT